MTAADSRHYAILALVLLGALGRPAAHAQTALRPTRVAVETVVSADRFEGVETPRATGIGLDAFVSIRLTDRLEFVTQPIVKRLGNGTWISRPYQLAVRYSGPGPLPWRLEVGQMMSPIGSAALEYRADLNPTVAYPASYRLRLPSFEAGGPRVELISAGYPVGAQVSASARGWDARVAVLDSSPVRYRSSLLDPEPPRSAQFVAGAGYTPVSGVRIGASFARGRYAKGEEMTRGARFDRQATVLGVEGEYSFRHTRLSGEWLRDEFETAGTPAVTNAWLVQWTQTLTPRWFAASRVERAIAPLLVGTRRSTTFAATDASVGYRLAPEMTLRLGYLGRRAFGLPVWDHQAAASVVWARRWW
jgi:hypothetical protein